MKRISRCLFALAVCGVWSAGIAAGGQAASADQTLICHGTASDKNPYVVISVDANALAGHFDGTAPGHGPNNHPDKVLPPDGTVADCGGEE